MHKTAPKGQFPGENRPRKEPAVPFTAGRLFFTGPTVLNILHESPHGTDLLPLRMTQCVFVSMCMGHSRYIYIYLFFCCCYIKTLGIPCSRFAP